jgi:hypothetical protein
VAQPPPTASYAARLRKAIYRSAIQYAERNHILHYLSLGDQPTVMFHTYGKGKHGNFHYASYQAILNHHSWQLRLGKPHPRRDALPEARRAQARELDSSNSSDALLMNVLCHPFALRSRELADLFGQKSISGLEFGFMPNVPLEDGKSDETEVDLRFSELLVEAKLTERDFTRKTKSTVEKYRDFRAVFDPALLPQTPKEYLGYQLIRNILAAHSLRLGFCLICDARRPDLLHTLWDVAQAVKPSDLRRKIRFVLWQELAGAAPKPLADFLRDKYRIHR